MLFPLFAGFFGLFPDIFCCFVLSLGLKTLISLMTLRLEMIENFACMFMLLEGKSFYIHPFGNHSSEWGVLWWSGYFIVTTCCWFKPSVLPQPLDVSASRSSRPAALQRHWSQHSDLCCGGLHLPETVLRLQSDTTWHWWAVFVLAFLVRWKSAPLFSLIKPNVGNTGNSAMGQSPKKLAKQFLSVQQRVPTQQLHMHKSNTKPV